MIRTVIGAVIFMTAATFTTQAHAQQSASPYSRHDPLFDHASPSWSGRPSYQQEELDRLRNNQDRLEEQLRTERNQRFNDAVSDSYQDYSRPNYYGYYGYGYQRRRLYDPSCSYIDCGY